MQAATCAECVKLVASALLIEEEPPSCLQLGEFRTKNLEKATRQCRRAIESNGGLWLSTAHHALGRVLERIPSAAAGFASRAQSIHRVSIARGADSAFLSAPPTPAVTSAAALSGDDSVEEAAEELPRGRRKRRSAKRADDGSDDEGMRTRPSPRSPGAGSRSSRPRRRRSTRRAGDGGSGESRQCRRARSGSSSGSSSAAMRRRAVPSALPWVDPLPASFASAFAEKACSRCLSAAAWKSGPLRRRGRDRVWAHRAHRHNGRRGIRRASGPARAVDADNRSWSWPELCRLLLSDAGYG